MGRSMMRAWVALVALLSCTGVWADDAKMPPPPKVAFNNYYVVDAVTGTVLAQSDADEAVPPASLTKLMTGYVVFEALRAGRIRLGDEVTVSEKAWKTGGTRMFIDLHSQVKVEDLVRGMLIQSGNDASVALAEHVAGSVPAFLVLMNERATTLGMKSSTFKNTTGLPAKGHLSSAHDLAILARAIISEFPEYYRLYAEREFSYNGITQQNRNALLRRDSSVDGMKTGHTASAGYCIVSSAEREGMRLVTVVLGAETVKARNDGALALLNYGFTNYETRKLFSAGQPLTSAALRGGASAALGLARDLYVTFPRGRYDALAASMDVQTDLAAPLAPGATVGSVKVSLAGKPLSSRPLVALQGAEKAGVWDKIKDSVGGLWVGEAQAAPP